MTEVLITAGVFLVLLLAAGGGSAPRWNALLGAGALTALASLLFGAAAGVGYHVALYRALGGLGVLGRRWWWSPTSYHRHLPAGRRRRVMFWFYAGVTGLFASLAGCLLMFAGIVAARFG